MKIEYRAVGGSGGYTLLMDESAGGTLETFKPRGSIAKQNVALAAMPGQVTSSYKQPLGNVTESIPLKFNNVYTSRALALAACRTVKLGILTNKTNLKVTEGSEIQFYPNAICATCEPEIQGQSVTFTMAFEADLVTATEPT